MTAGAFVDAGKLQPGDEVTGPAGEPQTLAATRRSEYPDGIAVYNFRVGGYHTYYAAAAAGDEPVLVHNADYFSGTERPWLTEATPGSIYTHIHPHTGRAVQNAIYDENGNVIAHIDFKRSGRAPSGHGHLFPPAQPHLGHGAGAPHYQPGSLPPEWSELPPGILPDTPIGD